MQGTFFACLHMQRESPKSGLPAIYQVFWGIFEGKTEKIWEKPRNLQFTCIFLEYAV